MPLPLVVVAIKCSAGGGFLASVADFLKQVIEKKILPDEEKREKISGKELIVSFAAGTVAGNILGTAVTVHARNATAWKALAAMGWAELVYAPLHISLCAGQADALEDNIPTIFGYVVVVGAGCTLVCDTLILTKAMAPSALHGVSTVMNTIEAVSWSSIASLLFIFTNKYADNQRNKTILHPSGAVSCIHTGATSGGQIVGNFVAFNMCVIPWWAHAPTWWLSSMVIFPAFVYCTCLNIEAGVKSREISGRTEPTPERLSGAQTRVSVMQVLPLGALPSGFVPASKSATVAAVTTKALAALCAAAYISYQQGPWETYMRLEKGDYRRVQRKDEEQAWGLVWREEGDKLMLDRVEEGSPAGLEDLVGRELFRMNDERVETVEEFNAAAQSVVVLNLDFVKQPEKGYPALRVLSAAKSSVGLSTEEQPDDQSADKEATEKQGETDEEMAARVAKEGIPDS